MGHYLFEVGYTPQSWNAQIDTEANVIDRITPALKACGGKLESMYYTFGDRDLIGIADFKTPEDAAAFSLAIAAGGAVTMYRTTPLLTIDQGMASMHKAKTVRDAYTPALTVNLTEQRGNKKSAGTR
jgi:uncharacterized protein with GYD domain